MPLGSLYSHGDLILWLFPLARTYSSSSSSNSSSAAVVVVVVVVVQ